MDQSRRAVESYWRSRMVDGVTADNDKVAPIDKLEESCAVLATERSRRPHPISGAPLPPDSTSGAVTDPALLRVDCEPPPPGRATSGRSVVRLIYCHLRSSLLTLISLVLEASTCNSWAKIYDLGIARTLVELENLIERQPDLAKNSDGRVAWEGDALHQVLGQEKHGQVHGMGLLPNPK